MAENQRIRLSKKMLKDSLIELLQKQSIHKISVRDICENAEINRTTFYKYYGSQYDLLADMENDLLAQIENMLVDKNKNMNDRLPLFFNFINDNIDLCRILMNNNVDPEFSEKLFNFPVIRNRSARLMPEYNDTEFEYVLGFTLNGGFDIVKRWINNENREPPEEIAALLGDLMRKLISE